MVDGIGNLDNGWIKLTMDMVWVTGYMGYSRSRLLMVAHDQSRMNNINGIVVDMVCDRISCLLSVKIMVVVFSFSGMVDVLEEDLKAIIAEE